MREERAVLDLSGLPEDGFGPRSLSWWGTWGYILIEGTGFVLMGGIYLYLALLAPQWPLATAVPDLWPGTTIAALLLASIGPNLLVARWGRQCRLRHVRIGLFVMCLCGLVPLAVRAFEFDAFHISWDGNAYGSAVWMLLGLHTAHIMTDLGETIVLTVLMFTRHGRQPRRFGDVVDNAMYWNFVVLSWLPIYLLLYWYPRI
jgi:heme/copper-type cytochrome/quinol oxidase subunit 3